MWALRAQTDKLEYAAEMRRVLEATPNLFIRESMVTGLDIVALQIEVARGRALPLEQDDVRTAGHAIECRINAEHPDSFVPSPGKVSRIHLPGGPGVRVDTHIAAGSTIPSSYDSMIGKVIAHGKDRAEALARVHAAVKEFNVDGVHCNAALHARLLGDPAFRQGGVGIHHLEHLLAEWEAENA